MQCIYFGLEYVDFILFIYFLSLLSTSSAASPRVLFLGEKLQQSSNAAGPAAALKAWRRSSGCKLAMSTQTDLGSIWIFPYPACSHMLPLHAPYLLNSALNWKQYWAPGLQNEFVYDYSCPGALRAPGNVYFIELEGILFSSPLQFMSVLARGRILIEMVWLSYKTSIMYRFRQPQGWPANAAAGKTWSD